MSPVESKTLFALDPGATNWRLYRAVYEQDGRQTRLLNEPAASPLTCFSERSMPAALILNESLDGLVTLGEAALAQLDNPEFHSRLRAHFKTSLGRGPNAETPSQYSHQEALRLTGLLLKSVINGIRLEKWRGLPFEDDVILSFAHPVHWAEQGDGIALADFKALVDSCLNSDDKPELRYVSEPEATIHSLQHRSLLPQGLADRVTLILDIGGSTTDLVASELTGDDPVFHSRYGGALGGDDYDAAVQAYLTEALNIPPEALNDDPALRYKLASIARYLKETLSRGLQTEGDLAATPQRSVTVVSAQGRVFRGTVELDEGQFMTLARPVTARFLTLFQEALDDMGLRDAEIGRLVLVGGGSQLFSLVRLLRERFGPERLVLADNPSETVVHGASLEYGAALAKRRPTVVFMVPAVEEPEPEPDVPIKRAWQLVSDSGQILPLQPGPNPIGRASSNLITIKSDKMSRWHAEIHLEDDGATVMDLGSTNGSYLDGVRLTPKQHTPLMDGAQLRFGDLLFRFVAVNEQ